MHAPSPITEEHAKDDCVAAVVVGLVHRAEGFGDDDENAFAGEGVCDLRGPGQGVRPSHAAQLRG
ncbi:hypothetical protein GCM10020000_86640 [Streptomyces olivoverticillatus]